MRDLIDRLVRGGNALVAVQTIAELPYVFTRKLRLSRSEAATRVEEVSRGAVILATTETVLADAALLFVRHDVPMVDAIILAAAAEPRCDVLYSEDFQPGFGWRGVAVVDPCA